MAYMSAKTAADIRQRLKDQFPPKDGWKLSVRKSSGSLGIDVIFLRGPFQFEQYAPRGWPRDCDPYREGDPVEPMTNAQINHFHLDSIYPAETAAVLKQASDIIHRDHWDKSDSQSDYFHCAFYVHLAVGEYGRPYEVTA